MGGGGQSQRGHRTDQHDSPAAREELHPEPYCHSRVLPKTSGRLRRPRHAPCGGDQCTTPCPLMDHWTTHSDHTVVTVGVTPHRLARNAAAGGQGGRVQPREHPWVLIETDRVSTPGPTPGVDLSWSGNTTTTAATCRYSPS